MIDRSRQSQTRKLLCYEFGRSSDINAVNNFYLAGCVVLFCYNCSPPITEHNNFKHFRLVIRDLNAKKTT